MGEYCSQINVLFFQIVIPELQIWVLMKHGSETSNNELPKYRKLGAEMPSVTVLANKKGLWIS